MLEARAMQVHNQSLRFLPATGRRRRDNSHDPTTRLVLPLTSYTLLPIRHPTVQLACWRRKLPYLRSLVGNGNGPEIRLKKTVDREQQALNPPDLRGLPASVRDLDTLGSRAH